MVETAVWGIAVLSLLASSVGLWTCWRATPAKLISECRAAIEAVDQLDDEVRSLVETWKSYRASMEASREEIDAAQDKLRRTRHRILREGEALNRRTGLGNDEQLDPMAAKVQELRANGWVV